jgi:chemotaxis methyl-accepting protein methylase
MWQERVSRLIQHRTGLVLSETTKQRLDGFVVARCAALGLSTPDDYVAVLEAGRLPAEFQEIVNTVAVSKTAFFRYPKHVDAVCQQLLPALDRVLDAGKAVHIWCAAVSSGEEIYSLAMALDHFGWFDRRAIKLLGTDINDVSLTRARRGEYHLDRETRETFPEYARDYLESARGEHRFRVVDHVRARVELAHANLNALTLRTDEAYHVVLCCNVLIYFDETNRRRVISDIQARMADHAALLLGAAEIAGQNDPRYRVRNVGGCFAHLRGTWPGLAVSDLGTLVRRLPAALEAARASAPPLPAATIDASAGGDPRPSARASVGASPTRAHIDPRSEEDTWRARARACLDSKQFVQACRVLEATRERDPFCVEAHFLYGQALRALGRRDEAESAFRRAVFLEPDFPLARYELGLMRHLQGDFAAAVREYQRVLGSLSSRGGRGPMVSGTLDLEEARGIEKFVEHMCTQNRELALAGVLPDSAPRPP